MFAVSLGLNPIYIHIGLSTDPNRKSTPIPGEGISCNKKKTKDMSLEILIVLVKSIEALNMLTISFSFELSFSLKLLLTDQCYTDETRMRSAGLAVPSPFTKASQSSIAQICSLVQSPEHVSPTPVI